MDLIIKAEKLHLEYSGREVLNIDELEFYSYDRIGLVGDNGAGKSTLLKILCGEITAGGAKVQRFGECAYISQLDSIEAGTVEDNALLSHLGVASVQSDTMSGGEETRVKIANALSQQVHGILADEPTCHLDRAGIDFLIGQLKAFDGALLLISHDRYFLDKVVDKIWELKDGKITEYWGGYSEYLQQKEEEARQQAVAYEQARLEKERLELAIQERYSKARQMDKKTKGAQKKNANESAGRLGHQKSIGSKQKKMHQAAKIWTDRETSVAACGR